MNIHSVYQTVHSTKIIFAVISILLTIGVNHTFGQTATLYLQNTQTQSGTGGPLPLVLDFSESQDAANTVTSAGTTSGTFVETLAFTMDVNNLSKPIINNQYNVSVNVSAVSNATLSARFRLQRVNSGGIVQASTGYSATFNSTGIKTAALSFVSVQTWASTDRLRLSIEVYKTGGGGSRTITVRTGNSNSWVNYLTPAISPSIYISAVLSTFIVPPGLTSVTVECVGAGGAGAATNGNPSIGGGGGGGAYASSVVAVVPGNSYPVKVGKGQEDVPLFPGDENSSFNTTTVVAKGGASVLVDIPTGGTGGSSALSTGSIKYKGGNGGTSASGWSGGGGGGAGSTGVGVNGAAPTAGIGTSLYGGSGGVGVNVESNGNPGNTFGGGGSGANSTDNTNYKGGFGANGIVVISWDTYYRTKASGNWNSDLIWEISYDNVTWYPAYCSPNYYNASTVTVLNGHTVTVTKNISVDEVVVEAGGQITVNAGITLTIVDGPGTDMAVNGTIANSGTITTTGTLVFNAASTYQHAQNGGTVPTATWDVPSTCTVTGITNSVPAGLTQPFGNFTWNSAGQSAAINFTNTLTIINGNLSILNTNNQILALGNTGYTINIFGNLIVGNGTDNVILRFSQTNGAATNTLNLYGNFSMFANATINTRVAGNILNFNFVNSGIQTFTKTGGTISGNLYNFNVISGSILDMGTSVLNGSTGTFTLNAGAGIITAHIQGLSTTALTGSIQLTGAKSYNAGANYTYNGVAAQVTGNGLTIANNLTINNAAGVTLSTNVVSVSDTLTLTNGLLNTTTNLLTITNGLPTAIAGGSATAYVYGPLKWTLPSSLTSGSGFIYNFPVGSATAYLPFALVNPTTGAGIVTAQVQAFSANPFGTSTAPLTSKSTTEYWSLATIGNFTDGSVSLARPTDISPFNVVAGCNTINGAYASLGGAYDTYGVSGSELIGNKRYFGLGVCSAATLGVSTNSITGFYYLVGYGPSNELSFKVSGFSLTGDIVITPPTNYEITKLSGGVFQSTPITLALVSGKVSATIYVRLKKDLNVGNYGPENITVASAGFTTKNVACSGTVVPDITVGGGGSYCSGGTINLTSTAVGSNNIYWEGPNSYYAIANNQDNLNVSITPAVAGTYTATASYVAGTNLVLNGDFTSGNTQFTSSYTYTTVPTMNEARYAIVPHPSDVHGGFCYCGDKTTGSGNQMVINGATVTGVNIWSPTALIVVTPNTNYQFTYWVQTVVLNNDVAPSQLQLLVNSVPAGPIYTADPTTGIWKQFKYNWNSGSSTTANLSLINQRTAASGNDFALDDIEFKQVNTSSASVVVTVITGTLPSVMVEASANPVNSGTNVTFTATPTNGGTAPTYQWKVNGANVGTDSPAYVYIPNHGDIVSCVMTSNSTCLNGGVNPFTSSVIMTVNTVVNYWKGTNSTNWGTASNWTAGYVPASGDNIIFATNPIPGNAVNDLVLDVDRTIGSLTNATTAPMRRLIIPPARGLTVNDSIISFDTDPERVYIQAYPDGTQQNGSLIFHNKTTSVYGTVEMYSKASITALDPPYKYNWQYFGIPLNSVQADPTFYGSYVRRWEETGDAISTHWIQLYNADVLQKFIGYEICHPVAKVIVFQGQLVNSDYNSGKLAKTMTARFPGQHILSNPYTAAINIKNIVFGADADSTVYLYNTGTFAAWSSATGAPGTNAGQYLSIAQNTAGQPFIPLEIPSMQAFLIRPNPNSSTFDNYTVGIHYSDVVMKNHDLQLAPSDQLNSPSDLVMTMIDVKSKNHSDRVWIFSDPTCTRGFDNGWDGKKMSGTALAPQLFALETDGNYQIDAVEDMNDTYLSFQAGQDLEDTLIFTHRNIEKRYAAVYLVDLVEDKTIDITAGGTQYAFVAESTPAPVKRFKIVTLPVEKGNPDADSLIKIFSSEGTVFVQNFSNLDGECKIYDIAGLYIKKVPFSTGITAVYNGLIPGAYIATATAGSEKVSKRLIVR